MIAEFWSISKVHRAPVSIPGLQSFRLYQRFTEVLSLSWVYRVPVSIKGLQSSCLYPGFTEFLSLSWVYRVPVSILGLQRSRLYHRFTEFPCLSKVYRVPVSIKGLQSSRLYPGFTEFLSLSRVYRDVVSIKGLASSVPVCIQDLHSSCFYIFLVSGKREGEEKCKEHPPFLHYYFLFLHVGCTVMLFHTGFYSAKRIWKELYKNLSVLWPNLKKLSGGLNLSRGLNMVGST